MCDNLAPAGAPLRAFGPSGKKEYKWTIRGTSSPSLNPTTILTQGETTLKRLVKRRERCVSDTTKQKLRIHALLLMANPLLMGALGQDKFGTTAVAFLKKYLDPVKVVNRGLSGLKQFWDKHSKG
jgi:hypothetical protein